MNTWDKMIATLDWSTLLKQGAQPPIPIELIVTIPMEWGYLDTVGLAKFNMN